MPDAVIPLSTLLAPPAAELQGAGGGDRGLNVLITPRVAEVHEAAVPGIFRKLVGCGMYDSTMYRVPKTRL